MIYDLKIYNLRFIFDCVKKGTSIRLGWKPLLAVLRKIRSREKHTAYFFG